jgi:hypothetical protein
LDQFLGGRSAWLTDYAGTDWEVVADRLKSPGFSIVAFDPSDDDILYAGSGSSMWGGGSGLYKSVDGGSKWTQFAGTTIGQGIGGLILRYIQPSTLTIYAGTDSGVWIWQGSKTVTQTQATQWQHVWTNTTPNKTSRVMDMLVTAETTPQLYIAVTGDTVYRVAANNPSGTWTRLGTGFPTNAQTIKIGNSPASPDLIYAAVEPPGMCNQQDEQSALLDIYTRRTSETTWTYVSRPTNASHICGLTYNAFIRVHPSNASIVFIAGVRGWRSTDGGQTFPDTIPTVHDDYKNMAFDPADSSVAYFVSDGGVYRCTDITGTISCCGRNNDLRTTMFYDIALANTLPNRILGGTQDNGNIMTDGSIWKKLSYGGDGKYTAIDPANSDTLVVQYQYADSVALSTDGGAKFNVIKNGLPSAKTYSGDPFLVMHPSNGDVMLLTAKQLYRTTDAGGQWTAIGPSFGSNTESVTRADIDGANNRYYAGTDNGRVFATSGATIAWQNIYTNPFGSAVAGILVDKGNPNILYVTFAGAHNQRVFKLTHSGGWPGSWTTENRTGDLSIDRTLTGGMNNAIRGLFKDPSADILYVGTNKGVYQGQLVNNQWTWLPDTCGMPITYISDLEYSSGVLRAATYGRGAFKRSLSNPTPDPYDTPNRNDSPATRTQLGTMIKPKYWFEPNLYLQDLNFDRLNDVDYFTTYLPSTQSDDCLPLGDPRLDNPRCSQCAFSHNVSAPDNPEPLEIRLYKPNGSVYSNPSSLSYLGYSVERPRDIFPSGQITFSVRSPNSCRSSYNLTLNFNKWDCEFEAPNLLVDAPLFKRILPELEDFSWMFPADPAMINRAFTGQAPAELPEQRLLFEWKQAGDFQSFFDIQGFGNLNATLYNASGNPIASAGMVSRQARSPGTANRKELSVPDLPAGWYALGFNQADFPTWFKVTFNIPRVFLPVVYR